MMMMNVKRVWSGSSKAPLNAHWLSINWVYLIAKAGGKWRMEEENVEMILTEQQDKLGGRYAAYNLISCISCGQPLMLAFSSRSRQETLFCGLTSSSGVQIALDMGAYQKVVFAFPFLAVPRARLIQETLSEYDEWCPRFTKVTKRKLS